MPHQPPEPDGEGERYKYALEPTDVVVARGDGDDEHPTHLLQFWSGDDTYGMTTYYVELNEESQEIEFVGHRTASARRYQKHQMIHPKYRGLLENEGYTIHDAAENIGPSTVADIESFLAGCEIDQDDVEVRVSAQHVSVTISPDGYLEDDAWDTYIETMRKYDEIEWADTQEVHYIPDAQVASLLSQNSD